MSAGHVPEAAPENQRSQHQDGCRTQRGFCSQPLAFPTPPWSLFNLQGGGKTRKKEKKKRKAREESSSLVIKIPPGSIIGRLAGMPMGVVAHPKPPGWMPQAPEPLLWSPWPAGHPPHRWHPSQQAGSGCCPNLPARHVGSGDAMGSAEAAGIPRQACSAQRASPRRRAGLYWERTVQRQHPPNGAKSTSRHISWLPRTRSRRHGAAPKHPPWHRDPPSWVLPQPWGGGQSFPGGQPAAPLSKPFGKILPKYQHLGVFQGVLVHPTAGSHPSQKTHHSGRLGQDRDVQQNPLCSVII